MLAFKNQTEDEMPLKWNIGIDRRRVALFVALALVAGFAVGYMTSSYVSRREGMLAKSAAATRPEPDLPAAVAQTAPLRQVTRVLRADSIEVEGIGPVRMIGIETPDGKEPRAVYDVHGQNALKFTQDTLLGQQVRLEFEGQNPAQAVMDETGYTPAYVYLRDGTLFNSELIRRGLAFVRTLDQFQMSNEFRSLEREALLGARGVWTTGADASASASAQTIPGANSNTASTTRRVPLQPSDIGPNLPALSGTPSLGSGTTSSEPTVVVSTADRMYHKSGCDLLGKKSAGMSLSEARSKGYAGCSKCFASTVMKAP
jgi:micrococcal nuclease